MHKSLDKSSAEGHALHMAKTPPLNNFYNPSTDMLHTLRRCVDLRILLLWWQIFKEETGPMSLVHLPLLLDQRVQLILKKPKLCFE